MVDPRCLTFSEFRRANVARLLSTPKFAHCTTWTPAQWVQALVGELGETANVLKKVDRGDFTLDNARGEVGKELADVMTYLDLLAYACGVDLGAATTAKWNEVSERVDSDLRLSMGHMVRMKTSAPTHYVVRNSGGKVFVKEAALFEQQGGLRDDWGKSWVPVTVDGDPETAEAIERARAEGERILPRSVP